jgi:hypothetical protein
MMNCTPRLSLFAPLLLIVSAGCSGAGTDAGDGGSSGSATATAGTGNPAGGTTSTTGGVPNNVPLAGSGQALGGGDQGTFFNADMSVQVMPQAGGSGGSGSGGSGGAGIPGDGNSYTSTIKGSISGTAVFTQRGEDVDLVVNLNNCPNGNHQFRIHDGYSCDNASTEGMPWGARGTGIGPDTGIACSDNKGTLMYTRSGADKTKNWTVGDHVVETDLTAHVVIVSDEKDPSSRAACGNFF